MAQRWATDLSCSRPKVLGSGAHWCADLGWPWRQLTTAERDYGLHFLWGVSRAAGMTKQEEMLGAKGFLPLFAFPVKFKLPCQVSENSTH